MQRAVVRVYLYLVVSCALIGAAFAVQNFVHDRLLGLGLTDLNTLPGFLDWVASLPIFHSVSWFIGFIVVGLIHWHFLRRDRADGDDDSLGIIRAFFVSGLAAAIGIRIIFAVIMLVRNVDVYSQGNIAIAEPLAEIVTWSVALAAVLWEWGARKDLGEIGATVVKCFALIGQWVLIVVSLWAFGQAIQSYLQAIFVPLPLCSPGFNVITMLFTLISQTAGQCAAVPPPLGATLTGLVALGALAIYTTWAARQSEAIPSWVDTILNRIDTVVGAAVGGIVAITFSVIGTRFLLDLATHQPQTTFPKSLLSAPDSLDVASYPFVGPLLAAVTLLVYGYVREARRDDSPDQEGIHVYQLTLAYPMAVAFFVGASLILGDILITILYYLHIAGASVSTDTWNFGLMILIPGFLGWVPLQRLLDGIGRGTSTGGALGVTLSGRIYVVSFLIATAGAALISFIVGLYIVVSPLLGTPVDPSGEVWPRCFAVTLIAAPFALYYHRMRDDW